MEDEVRSDSFRQTELTISTEGFSEVIDLKEPIQDFLAGNPGKGLLNIAVPGSTASVTTIEYESGCLEDLRDALDSIAPEDDSYKHNEKWGDGNGFSHLRSSLMGPSVTLPFKGGELQTGTWQQVVLVDNDNRPRERSVLLTALGS
ncbi:MAG: secondary thiamine-phosphate synthase enzyme YjbQ [bacterium]